MESLLEILTNRRSQVYKIIDVHSVTNVLGESISSMRMWNIVNQWGNYDSFSCELVVNNLKEKKLPAQVNRNCFDLILARRYWNCFTMDSLRCLNSAVPAVMMKSFYKTLCSSTKHFVWQSINPFRNTWNSLIIFMQMLNIH